MAEVDSAPPSAAADEDILAQAKKDFEAAQMAERDNREAALADLRFARLDEQWPDSIKLEREADRKPCLTISKLPAFIRQVVNDARQNKPSIKVHPVDSAADPETADILSGLIRNIEYTSNADVAYDTAVESAVSGGFGYIRVGLDYAHDDTFDMDLTIDRVSNPFEIYGDPSSRAADSSDWNRAFIITELTKDEFTAKYKGAEAVDWEATGYTDCGEDWFGEDRVIVAEYWTREEVEKKICQLADGATGETIGIFAEDDYPPDIAAALEAGALQKVRERVTKSWKVTQRILTGAEVLETTDWPGKYIPIVPVYGDEVDVEGKRHFRSLIRSAKDAQRMYNYWRSAATEMVALAPKVPFIGPKGAFKSDAAKWKSANRQNWSYLEYDGNVAPQRQPLDSGVAAGALQEALNANDDMKAILGIYDASLGARSNETSGRAIMARQREGDTATFHFADNMSRAIRHVGRILIDLIPKVYDRERIIRTIGEDGSQEQVPVNQEVPMGEDPETGDPMFRVFDLSAGKYDLTCSAGPSFTTRRQEAAEQMTAFVQAAPDAAPILMPMIAKNSDWPDADKVAEKLQELVEPPAVPPEVEEQMAQMQEQLQQAEAMIQEAQAAVEAAQAEAEAAAQAAEIKRLEIELKHAELDVKRAEIAVRQQELANDNYRAETERIEAQKPPEPPAQPLAA